MQFMELAVLLQQLISQNQEVLAALHNSSVAAEVPRKASKAMQQAAALHEYQAHIARKHPALGAAFRSVLIRKNIVIS